MTDRYTKTLLSIIAAALVYLCVVLTPLPGVSAQQPSARPGEPSGPTDVVIVGWRAPDGTAFPVAVRNTVQVTSSQPLRITGAVTTERSDSELADRVVVVGWEPGATREKPARMRPISDTTAGLPVRVLGQR